MSASIPEAATASGLTDYLFQLFKRGHQENHGDARAALAQLRRGLADDPRHDPRVMQIVGRHLPPEAGEWETDAHLVVACLFARYVQGREHMPSEKALPKYRRSLGASVRVLRNRLQAEGAGAESLDKRFLALLDARADDVPVRLRHLTALMSSKKVPIRWDRLLRDLRRWKRARRDVTRGWAEDYWRAPSKDEDDESDDT